MWRLLIPLLLAACSDGVSGPCRLQPVADLPVLLDHGSLEVAGRVNGAETRLVIDTGAALTVLTAATVASLQLPRSQRTVTRLSGLIGPGGAVSNADVFADLQLGDLDVRRRLAVADIPGIGGLVGADVLSDYDVEFDLPDHRVKLWKAPGCGAADLPWAGPRAAVPVRVSGDDRLRLPVALDGMSFDALLDSGAAFTLLQADAARRLGVTQASLAAYPGAGTRGVDGGAFGVQVHRFGALTVGQERVAGPRIGVAGFQLGGIEMLLGLDFFRTRRVWVAYRTGQIYVQAARSGT